MAWILVTPSSRGIGAALTRHLLRTTPATIPIVATTRASDPKSTRESLLDDLKKDLSHQNNNNNDDSILSKENTSRLDVQRCDLLSENSIIELSSYCKEKYNSSPTSKTNPTHLRLAFLVPGMLQPEKSPQQIEYDSALETLKLNLLAPMMLIKHFVPFLPRKAADLSASASASSQNGGLPASAVMACMSARVGSISDNGLGGWYSYRASKAGLNQVVKSTDLYVKVGSARNAAVIGLHPGTVKTGLSKEFWANVKKDKLFEPEYAADRLVQVVRHAGGDVDGHRGRCWDWKGEEVPP